ncbi:hypothetical protein ABW21_db0205664 [Orbilia brochopaga]|nr:hypothetical protein ABW21_db0205664 [Drechslerella brochopaga]
MAYTTKLSEKERLQLLQVEAGAIDLKISPMWDFGSSRNTGSSGGTDPDPAETGMFESRFAPKPAEPQKSVPPAPRANIVPQTNPPIKQDAPKQQVAPVGQWNSRYQGQGESKKARKKRRQREAQAALEAAIAADPYKAAREAAAKAKLAAKTAQEVAAKAKQVITKPDPPKPKANTATTPNKKQTTASAGNRPGASQQVSTPQNKAGAGPLSGFNKPPPTGPKHKQLGPFGAPLSKGPGPSQSGGAFGGPSKAPITTKPAPPPVKPGIQSRHQPPKPQNQVQQPNVGSIQNKPSVVVKSKGTQVAFNNTKNATPAFGWPSSNTFAYDEPKQPVDVSGIGPHGQAFGVQAAGGFGFGSGQAGGSNHQASLEPRLGSTNHFGNHGSFGNRIIPAFGQTTPLGNTLQAAKPSIGFGSTPSSAFAGQNPTTFGNQNPGAFGVSKPSAFGLSASQFGQDAQRTAGSQTTGAFGFQNTSSAFGNPPTPAFGNTQNTAFTAKGPGIFGTLLDESSDLQKLSAFTPLSPTALQSFDTQLHKPPKSVSPIEQAFKISLDFENRAVEPMPPPLLFSIGGRNFAADINKILNGPQQSILMDECPTPVQKPVVGSSTSLAGPGHDHTIKNLEDAVKDALGRRNYSSSDSSGDSPGFMIRNLMTEEGFHQAWQRTVGTEKERLQQMFRILVEMDFRRQKAYVRGQIDETDLYIANMDPQERALIERERLTRQRRDIEDKQNRKQLINAENNYKETLRQNLHKEAKFLGGGTEFPKPQEKDLGSSYLPKATFTMQENKTEQQKQPQKIVSAFGKNTNGPEKSALAGPDIATSCGFDTEPSMPTVTQPSALAASRWATTKPAAAAPKPAAPAPPSPKKAIPTPAFPTPAFPTSAFATSAFPSKAIPTHEVELEYSRLHSRASELGYYIDLGVNQHNRLVEQGSHSIQCSVQSCPYMKEIARMENEKEKTAAEAAALESKYIMPDPAVLSLRRLAIDTDSQSSL